MSLYDRAREARAHADSCIEPSCHAAALAFEGAVAAEARQLMDQLNEEPDLSGIPDPPVETIRIPKPGTEN